MDTFEAELAECRKRLALGASLNTLLNFNPDFKALVVQGYLHDEVQRHGLNINADKSGSITALKAIAAFNKYLDKVKLQAEQAQVDIANYQNLISNP